MLTNSPPNTSVSPFSILPLHNHSSATLVRFQERRALLFCKEDRAILCRDCDLRMHKANEHTQKHNRFLLTGVKLSSFDVPNQLACSPSSGSESSAVSYTTQTTIVAGSATYETSNPQVVETSQEGLVSDTSSISEYLLETLPGWHVQDFLDYPSSSTTYDFCKLCLNLPFTIILYICAFMALNELTFIHCCRGNSQTANYANFQ
nr:B-box zinc finger protein 20 [Ipomoea batatas]